MLFKERYAATGDFACSGLNGQANLTVQGDVITTAAHMVYGDVKCNQKAALRSCTFTVQYMGKIQTAHASKIINSGFKCPGGPFDPTKDWIVLKLDKLVDGVKPYRVDADKSSGLSAGQDVIAVGKSIDFLPSHPKVPPKDYRDYPKHIAGLPDSECV